MHTCAHSMSLCVSVYVFVWTLAWFSPPWPEKNLQIPVFSFCYMDCGHQTQAMELGCECLFLLSHLSSLVYTVLEREWLSCKEKSEPGSNRRTTYQGFLVTVAAGPVHCFQQLCDAHSHFYTFVSPITFIITACITFEWSLSILGIDFCSVILALSLVEWVYLLFGNGYWTLDNV